MKKRFYIEIVEACYYCSKNTCTGWDDESHCQMFKPAKVFKGMYMKGFPKWCPLKNYKKEENNGK